MTNPEAESHRVVRALQWLGRTLRDGWLMVGITLVMLLALESAYRGQSVVRHALRPANKPGAVRHPYADSAWYRVFVPQYDSTFGLQWRSYVYFRRPPFSGSLINVDSSGHRRTLPGPRVAQDTVRVFVFGGSTLWGTDLRDASTIPSVLSRQLASAAPEGRAIEVTNFGESGYVFTQGMLELQLQLRSGHVPNVVVFYDGINDIAAAAQYGEAGLPQNEGNRSREFQMGRAIYGAETGVGSDKRAAAVIVQSILQRFQVFQRIVESVGRRAAPSSTPEQLVRNQVHVYESNVRIIEALSRAYGFKAVYVWQPTLHTTTKRLTPWEQQLLAEIKADDYNRRLQAMHRAILPMLDSVMPSEVGKRFVNASSLFAGDTLSVFTDVVGHNTEQSIPTIVGAIAPAVSAVIDSVAPAKRRDVRSR